MTASILIATPHIPFGELLRISLEETGLYRTRLVQSGQEARAAASRQAFQLAILDSSLEGEPFALICLDLLTAQPELRLVVIPPENDPNHPALGGLMPHGYLSRPFYLPDMLETLARLLPASQPVESPMIAGTDSGEAQPPWLQDGQALSAYLETELAGSEALSGMVGQAGPLPGDGLLRAAAGELAGTAALELCETVFRYWNRSERTDLMRFLRLGSEKQDLLIYATQISGDLVLALAFDQRAPLSQVRPQARGIAQTLLRIPPEGYRAPQEEPEAPHNATRPPLSASIEPATQPIKPIGARARAEQAADAPRVSEDGETQAETKMINLSALLGASPRQDPAGAPPAAVEEIAPAFAGLAAEPAAGIAVAEAADALNAWLPADLADPDPPAGTAAAAGARDWPLRDDPTIVLGRRVQPAPPQAAAEGAVRQPGAKNDRAPETFEGENPGDENPVPAEFLPAASVPFPDPAHLPAAFHAALPDPQGREPLEETRPGGSAAIARLNQLEPASPTVSRLNYSCVLVPRLPQHLLTGELAERMAQWLAQLCLAYGWRLEGIAVRPEYVQWSVQVAPAVSPGGLVRTIRQRTSFYIFSTFNGLTAENPSGDFWATGYLIVSGPQPPSAQLLRDYIAQTRKRQGLLR